MFTQPLQNAFNEQIKHEFYSAYFYLGMSAYCKSNNLFGAAKWLKVQAEEEQEHALKFFKYIEERGGKVELQAIAQPPATYASLLDLFEQVLAHEQKVTALINRLYELAVKEADYPSQFMLQWFINEQVEEESSASLLVTKIKMVKDNPSALYLFDQELAQRVFNPAAEN